MDKTIFDSPESFHAELKRMGEAQPVRDAISDTNSGAGPVEPMKSVTEFDASLGVEQPMQEVDQPADQGQANQELKGENESAEQEVDESLETKSHMIPKSRLNKELEKRKSLEQELQTTREAQIRAETQLQLLSQLQQQARQQEPKQERQVQPQLNPLDPESFDYQSKEINAIKQELQQSRQFNEQMYMQQTVHMQENMFKQQHPDFEKALEHVKQVQLNVNKMTSGNDQQAEKAAAEYIGNILRQSVNNGKNAAEVIYNMAQNFGYKNGSAKRSAPPTTNIDAIAKNTDKSASISGVGANMAINTIPDDMRAIVDKNGRYNKDDFHKLLKAVGNKPYVG